MPIHTEESAARQLLVNVAGLRARSDTAVSSEAVSPSSTGPAAAAILAAGVGVFVLGLCSILGDAFPGMARIFNWLPRTGPLSGVTGCAVALWLLSWWTLRRLWDRRPIGLRRINLLAALLFMMGLLLSFPPFMDLLQGK